ncbi:hypothetical protein AWQ21_02170 [Picosynechococcus sp. PCC 7003]|uniref:hypothetical protein n=1 Tax=Picosynechococcus sp. PCC 7003 TaxID=374981 RepID=UPI0008106404|nr:hypothetical protein [Picosynechococcus sp. PCC 7003]ANV83289.1 hypothetical protein AWQ21_02170 [Picosynechococcus sp. PCC 7003]
MKTMQNQSQHKKILCIAIIFFDFEVIKKSIDFMVSHDDMLDIVILENPSEFTQDLIKPYIQTLLEAEKIKQYILFDNNITNNAVEIFVDHSNTINWEDYDYILLTDGDLIVEGNGWLCEEIEILNKYSDIFACAVGLDIANLPVKTFPEAVKWVPPPIAQYDGYTETLTGIHLVLLKTEKLLKFLNWRKKNGFNFIDSSLHFFCYEVLKEKWVIIKNSQAKHLTWDSYQDLSHPYTKFKIKKTFTETWNHQLYSGYTIFTKGNLSTGQYCSTKKTFNSSNPKVTLRLKWFILGFMKRIKNKVNQIKEIKILD